MSLSGNSDVASASSQWLLPLVVSAVGGAVFGALASVFWRRRSTHRAAARRPASGGGDEKKMKVYHKRTFRSARVSWIVAEMGVSDDFLFVPYDPYTASEDERQWYSSSVHPHGTVPALVNADGRTLLVESGAICLYLAERYGQLLPPPDSTSDYFDWVVYAVATVDPLLSTIETEVDLKPEQQNRTQLDKAFAGAELFARRLETQLAKRDYICGSSLTAADVVVGYCVMWASVLKGGRIIFDCPNVKAYLGRLKARAQFTETMGTAREWINSAY